MTIPQLYDELQQALEKELLVSGMQKCVYLASIRLYESSMWYDRTDFTYKQKDIEKN